MRNKDAEQTKREPRNEIEWRFYRHDLLPELSIEQVQDLIVDGLILDTCLLSNLGLSTNPREIYKAYANKLNWRRPRGRKIGWRGLNRRQKQLAMYDWAIKK